ncbi:PREDICTED: uncharacterized protein At1g04910-like isoform X2 [Brassica oleracea var. oleracea]|uniref:uncharacterized protein At1g04910-like isoform X2 n=1 Tax=Brassica oleracea var. oleracea TaxID=109376 RepID=UPI0006A75407|nr:PREDICTED: uncharacterized protein At1g04910-like isoform X2 [Brassica oleracea var. oleracea]
MRRLGSHRIHGRMVANLSIGVIVLLICTLSLLFSANVGRDREPARSSKLEISVLLVVIMWWKSCGRVLSLVVGDHLLLHDLTGLLLRRRRMAIFVFGVMVV